MEHRTTLLKKYEDDSFRIISENKLQEGDKIYYTDHYTGNESSRMISSISEERPAMGIWKDERPLSYRLHVV